MSSNRDFRGIWIPAEIWLTKELTVGEKLMYVEIESLSKLQRGCFASNAHFAEMFSISNSRVSEIISSLAVKGFVSVEQKRQGVRTVQRIIQIIPRPHTSSENTKNPFGKHVEGSSENTQGKNTSLSNTEKEETLRHPQAEDIPYEAIFDKYNEVCGKTFKGAIALTPKRKANIKTLFNLKIKNKRPFKEHGMAFWEAYFNDCLENSHWRGQNDRGWKADLEFLTRPEVATKLLEGTLS
ncbi:hypothetical protein [Pseudomonas sp. MONT-RG-20F-20-E-7-02]|uniref:hypothetical protein n=1 Tax=Pseudomonas sp. MONT-RG-20F-20-E-7-02 TaxID=2914979 RepID=UPI001F560D76|nr:hypothetical protein [Pseudomonas sp. MONT-RG-20F-20-E-7-02]